MIPDNKIFLNRKQSYSKINQNQKWFDSKEFWNEMRKNIRNYNKKEKWITSCLLWKLHPRCNLESDEKFKQNIDFDAMVVTEPSCCTVSEKEEGSHGLVRNNTDKQEKNRNQQKLYEDLQASTYFFFLVDRLSPGLPKSCFAHRSLTQGTMGVHGCRMQHMEFHRTGTSLRQNRWACWAGRSRSERSRSLHTCSWRIHAPPPLGPWRARVEVLLACSGLGPHQSEGGGGGGGAAALEAAGAEEREGEAAG